MEENKDVDLYAELEKTLAGSEEQESSVASDQKPTEDGASETPNTDENDELSEEDISKLSPRAQKRIREQAAEIKRLAELADKSEPQEDEKPDSQNFKNVQEYLDAVEDPVTRNLLEKGFNALKSEMSNTLAPIEARNNETKFETEFAQYEKIEGISDYKNDLKQTFLRNPNQSIKALVSEVAMDIQLNKVKPIEKTPSSPNRGEVDTSNLSKDELYSLLESSRG